MRRAIQRAVVSQVASLGLSSVQFWILVGVAERPRCCQTELAAHLRIDEPSLSRVLRGLSAKGWVRAVRAGADRRRVHLELTTAGGALARRLRPIARAIRGAVEEALTPGERLATRSALTKILRYLDELAARPTPLSAARPSSRTAPATPRSRAALALKGSP